MDGQLTLTGRHKTRLTLLFNLIINTGVIITTTFEVLNFFIANFYCLILLLVLNASRIQLRGHSDLYGWAWTPRAPP